MGGPDHPLPLNGHEVLVQVRHVCGRGSSSSHAPFGLRRSPRRGRHDARGPRFRPTAQQVEGGIAEMDDAFVVSSTSRVWPTMRSDDMSANMRCLRRITCSIRPDAKPSPRHQHLLQRNHDRVSRMTSDSGASGDTGNTRGAYPRCWTTIASEAQAIRGRNAPPHS